MSAAKQVEVLRPTPQKKTQPPPSKPQLQAMDVAGAISFLHKKPSIIRGHLQTKAAICVGPVSYLFGALIQ